MQYGHFLEERPDDLTDYARESLEKAKQITGADYARAMHGLEQLQFQVGVLMESYDLLLTPTTSVPAFPVGQPPATVGNSQVDVFWGYTPFTFTFNLTGQPAASVPCGFSSEGLPIGLHVVGRKGDEAAVLRASAAFERARPWADKRPPVS